MYGYIIMLVIIRNHVRNQSLVTIDSQSPGTRMQYIRDKEANHTLFGKLVDLTPTVSGATNSWSQLPVVNSYGSKLSD